MSRLCYLSKQENFSKAVNFNVIFKEYLTSLGLSNDTENMNSLNELKLLTMDIFLLEDLCGNADLEEMIYWFISNYSHGYQTYEVIEQVIPIKQE